jgi:ABC-type Fe3+/spermidine/putrescine transport system ATPase subunit
MTPPASSPGGATPAAPGPVLELRNVSVGYDGTPVVHDVSLAVAADEGVAILGPSGSGKTTLLYAIAGFAEPMSGEIVIRGRSVAGGGRVVPPEDRRVGVVFQHFALWPHLSALDTVAYPLRRRGLSRAEAGMAAAELLGQLSIGHLAGRRPAQLSGGEQQRVGLARALARAPDVYLLDEPTAHLDTALKAALQTALASSGRGAGVATLYATHDVAEAMAVADRVALMRDGRLVQVGAPVDVYRRPLDRWAAELTGPASVLSGVVVEADGSSAVADIGGRRLRVACDGPVPPAARQLLVRPDWLALGAGELSGRVVASWYRGTHTDYRVSIGSDSVLVRDPGPPRLAAGETTSLTLHRVWPLPAEAS